MPSVRSFVALEIADQGVLDSLASFQKELLDAGADLKAVERENIHFTLKFLGEISDAQASDAGRRLGSLRLRGGTIEVKGVGAFPSPSRPNVVWVGVAPEDEGLVLPIAESVIDVLADIGQREDRPFRPHATVARVRSGRAGAALASLLRSNSGRNFGRTRLAAVKLKSSILTPSGPVYRDLGEYPLA